MEENLDKRAVKAEKSKEKTSFFAPRKPKSVEEANVTEVTDVEESDEAVEESDGSIKIEEKVVYEEISEEERYITRKQFLGKALGGTFGAFMGIQALAWLGFLWPKVSGGFGSKVDAGKIEDLKTKSYRQMDQSYQHLFQKLELMYSHLVRHQLEPLNLQMVQLLPKVL